MIRHFFLDKTNTIIEKSNDNFGLNPILQLGYGPYSMRGLIHFNIEEIKCLIEDKTFANTDKLKFTLNMVNCFSVDGLPYEKQLTAGKDTSAFRASSFDLMLFKLPCSFDQGRGFDYSSDFWITNKRSHSTEASNWFYSSSLIPWKYEKDNIDYNDKSINWNIVKKNLKGGIYSNETLEEEYNKYINGEESIVIGIQHFDFGNENLSIDITDYVINEIQSNGNNYGLGLAFTPTYEKSNVDKMQYVGFFTDTTNTFFHPFVEANYQEYIYDERDNFIVGKDNNLYLYVSVDGQPTNLDELPICTLDGIATNVTQVTKGVYCSTIDGENMESETIFYDVWSNIYIDEKHYDDVEMEFPTQPKTNYVKIGSNSQLKNNVVPTIYGINDDEKVAQGEEREITVEFRKEYTTDKSQIIKSADYRLYIKDGNREYDVITYQPIEKAFLNNYFIIYTKDLIPNEYYIDIRTKIGRETLYFKNILHFRVVSNITNRYE